MMESSNAVSFGASVVTHDLYRRKQKLEEMIEVVFAFRRAYNQINSGTILMMMLIARFSGFHVYQLEKMAKMDKSATTRHIQLLERMGLIEKDYDPDDLRAKKCCLTEAGSQMMKEMGL